MRIRASKFELIKEEYGKMDVKYADYVEWEPITIFDINLPME